MAPNFNFPVINDLPEGINPDVQTLFETETMLQQLEDQMQHIDDLIDQTEDEEEYTALVQHMDALDEVRLLFQEQLYDGHSQDSSSISEESANGSLDSEEEARRALLANSDDEDTPTALPCLSSPLESPSSPMDCPEAPRKRTFNGMLDEVNNLQWSLHFFIVCISSDVRDDGDDYHNTPKKPC